MELTGGLRARQRLTLHTVSHSVHVDQVLRLRRQSSQSEVVPRWGQPLVLCTPTASLLVADEVSTNAGGGGHPARRE